MKKTVLMYSVLAACLGSGVAHSVAQDKPALTMVAYGGEWQESVKKALWEPIFEKLGYVLQEDSLTGIAQVRLQVQSGAVVWDIVGTGIGECAAGEKEGLWEPIDYSVAKNAMDLPEKLRGKSWIGGTIWAGYVLAWNKDKYPENPPNSWADFWDVEKFPGTRAAYNSPRFMLEAALLADGVPKDEIYPIDMDRAFAKLRELKPHIDVWYTSFGQAVQLMKDNELDIVPNFDGRTIDVIKDGGNWDFTWNDGVTNAGCNAIVKGTPNKEKAMLVMNELNDAAIQARLPQFFSYGPVNPKSYENGLIPDDIAKNLNSHPDNMKLQLILDPAWWGDNHAAAERRWSEFMAE
jgi:putative spermidine/putrescine transport system substrate-binding protein